MSIARLRQYYLVARFLVQLYSDSACYGYRSFIYDPNTFHLHLHFSQNLSGHTFWDKGKKMEYTVSADTNTTLGRMGRFDSTLWLHVGAVVLDNYLAIAGSILLVMLIRWNYSVLICGGGWHGEGRPAQKRRISKDMLPPYPNGWYKILDQDMLPKKKVMSVRLCGKKLVAFRTEEGKVGVLDAYCPHLGADLGVHGHVEDGCIVCPFHAWKFNPDGACDSIQYSDCVPKDSTIQSYEALEANGVIYIWYDAELRDPQWMPPIYDEIAKGDWYLGAWSGHEILTHIAELPENGPDSAHLNVLHKEFIYQSSLHPEKKGEPFVKHVWSAEWEVDKEQPHTSKIHVEMDIGIGKWIPGFANVPVSARQVGPALVFLELNTYFGKILMAQNVWLSFSNEKRTKLSKIKRVSLMGALLGSEVFFDGWSYLLVNKKRAWIYG